MPLEIAEKNSFKVIEPQRTTRFFLGRYARSHFAPAFYFLAPQRRQALKILYAFFRVLDDAVDTQSKNAPALIKAWKQLIINNKKDQLAQFGHGELAQTFIVMVEKYDVPKFALIDFLEKGVGVDLVTNRFETPMDLESYCYGVAGTVGLCCLSIFGVPWHEANDFAVRLGIAVQWVNTIRDVGVDLDLGRIYLPQEHLDWFGVKERDLLLGNNSLAFQRLMEHETGVARSHYKRAMELLPPRWEKELLPAKIMGVIYMDLLEKLEKLKYPVFEQKVALNWWEKATATWRAVRERR